MSQANGTSQGNSLKYLLEDDGDAVNYSLKVKNARNARKYLNARVMTIELLITLAVIVLLFSFYQAVLTNVCLLYTSPSPRD